MKITLAALYVLANTCAPDMPIDVVAGIVDQESGRQMFAINVNYGKKQVRQPKTLQQAIKTIKRLSRQNINFDAGLSQINSKNFKWLGLTPATVFNPCSNLNAAQRVYLLNQAKALIKGNSFKQSHEMALSAYNTGNFKRGFRNGYVQNVTKKQQKHYRKSEEVLLKIITRE